MCILSTCHDSPVTFLLRTPETDTMQVFLMNTILLNSDSYGHVAARLEHCVIESLANLGFCKVICNLPTCHGCKPCTFPVQEHQKRVLLLQLHINRFIHSDMNTLPCSTSSEKCSYGSKWFSVVNFNVSKLYLFYWGKLVRCVIWGWILTHLCCAVVRSEKVFCLTC